jgi:hypothetical protein
MKRLGIRAPLVAHVGDGNFHFTLLVNPNDKNELNKASEFNRCIVDEALKVGGTCTGGHGIGLGKKPYLIKEHEDSLFLMQYIKHVFDLSIYLIQVKWWILKPVQSFLINPDAEFFVVPHVFSGDPFCY